MGEENIFKESGKNSSQSLYKDSFYKNSDQFISKEFNLINDDRNFWPTKLTNFISMLLTEDFAKHNLNFEELIDIYCKTTFDNEFKEQICKVGLT